MSKIAVFQTGGKQYLAQEGDVLLLEKIDVEDGKAIKFEEVLLTATEKNTKIGTPTIAGARIEAKVLEQGKHPKVFGTKMKAKKRQKKYFGHKQPYTKIEITKISTK